MAHTRWDLSRDWSGHPEYERAGWCMALAQVVYDERNRLGWDLEEFAGRSGMSIDDAEMIEGSAVYPSHELLAHLARVFGAQGAMTSANEEGERITFVPRAA